MSALPRAVRPLAGFAALLRAHGFRVAPEQTTGFLAAVELLGPSDIGAVRRAAHALLAPPPERHPEFDALFRAWFHGGEVALADPEGAARPPPRAAGGAGKPPARTGQRGRSGGLASGAEALAHLRPGPGGADRWLARVRRDGPAALPRRRSARRRAVARGPGIDLRRSLRSIVRHDGDLPRLVRTERRVLRRPLLVLIDVSGSMRGRAEDCLRFAHALAGAGRVEVFTFGTRLTRISPALARRRPEAALAAAAATERPGQPAAASALKQNYQHQQTTHENRQPRQQGLHAGHICRQQRHPTNPSEFNATNKGPGTATGPPYPIQTVYHGTGLAALRAHREGPDALSMVAVGTLRACKGFDTLIGATAKLKRSGVPVRLTIVGDGEERPRLARLADRLGLNGSVSFTGYIPNEDVVGLYARSTVLVHPARAATHFGIPNVIVEAQAARLPVVCTPLPALAELIEDGTSGVYVPEDDAEKLAAALADLYARPDRRHRLAAEGLSRVTERFDILKTAGDLADLFSAPA